MSDKKSLLADLEMGKERAENRTFAVTITETLQKTVTVEAKNRLEAEQVVSDAWDNSEYILDADNFVSAEFKAEPQKRDHAKGAER